MGEGQGGEVNRASLNVMLLPKNQRERSQDAIMEEVREATSSIVGVQVFTSYNSMFGGMSSDPFDAYITGPDLYRVAELAQVRA